MNPFFLAGLYTTILGLVSVNGARPISDEDSTRIYAALEDQLAEAADRPIFAGEAGVEATALALAAIAYHESGFQARVQDCSICSLGSQWCDAGRSIGAYQLHIGAWGEYTRDEICEDNRVSTHRALQVLARYRRSGSTDRMFCGYAMGGVRERCNRASAGIDAIYRRLAQQSGIVVVSGAPMTARWVKTDP